MPESLKLVALGDSIGYGLSAFPDRTNRSRSTLSGFNDQFAAFLSLHDDDYVNLACPGDKAADLLMKLGRSDFQDEIAAADILTVSIGGNNLLGPSLDALCRLWDLNPADYVHAENRSLFSDLKEAIAARHALEPDYRAEQDFMRLANLRDPAAIACRIALIRGIFAFSREWPKIILQIRQLNGRARIFVVTVPSPKRNGEADNRFEDFYLAIEALANAINRVIRKHRKGNPYQILDLNRISREIPNAMTFDITGAMAASVRLMQTAPDDAAYAAHLLEFLEKSDLHPSYAGHVAVYEELRRCWTENRS